MSCCDNTERPPTPFPEGTQATDVRKLSLQTMMQRAVPGITVLQDGSIEFMDGPIPVTGYVQDPDNATLLRPIWGECEKRMIGAVSKPEQITLRVICQHKESKQFGRIVSGETCQGCPLRKQ